MRSDTEEEHEELQQVAEYLVQLSALCGPMFPLGAPLGGKKSRTTFVQPCICTDAFSQRTGDAVTVKRQERDADWQPQTLKPPPDPQEPTVSPPRDQDAVTRARMQ